MAKKFIDITEFKGELKNGGTTFAGRAKGTNPNLISPQYFTKFKNVIFADKNIIRKRRGYTAVYTGHRTTAGTNRARCFLSVNRNGVNWDIYNTTAARMYAYNNLTAPVVIDNAGVSFSDNVILNYDNINKMLFFCDANGDVFKWNFNENGETMVHPIAVPAPTVAPTKTEAAGSLSGEYRYKYTYVLNTGTETELVTNYLTATVTSKKVTVTMINPGNGHVSYAWLYRTRDLTGVTDKDAEPYYFINSVAMPAPGAGSPSITDETDDGGLVTAATVYGYDTPRGAVGLMAHDRYLTFGNSTIYVSDIGKPDSMRAALQIRRSDIKPGDEFHAAFELGPYIYAATKASGLFRLTPTGSLEAPYSISRVEGSEAYGSKSHHVAVMGGAAFMIHSGTPWVFDGVRFYDIGGAERESFDYLSTTTFYDIYEAATVIWADNTHKAVHFIFGTHLQALFHLLYFPARKAWASWSSYIDRGATLKEESGFPVQIAFNSQEGQIRFLNNQWIIMKMDFYGTPSYQDYISATEKYNVEVELEQKLNFKGKSFINALQFYTQVAAGQNQTLYFSKDQDAYGTARTVKATPKGGLAPVNIPCERFNYKVINDLNEDFMVDYWRIMAPGGHALALADDVGA